MTEPTAHRALERLLDLAGETRPDINRHDLQGAILAAETGGWGWGWILVEVAQMLARGETPYDLRNAARAPWRHNRKAVPNA